MVKVQRSNFLYFVIFVLMDRKEVIHNKIHFLFFFTNELRRLSTLKLFMIEPIVQQQKTMTSAKKTLEETV